MLTHVSAMRICFVTMDFCKEHVQAILELAPVAYVKDMVLHGSLFNANCTIGAVSLVFTSFYIGHSELLEALDKYKQNRWVLGELLDGHEFLIILPTKWSVSTDGLCFNLCRLHRQITTWLVLQYKLPYRFWLASRLQNLESASLCILWGVAYHYEFSCNTIVKGYTLANSGI